MRRFLFLVMAACGGGDEAGLEVEESTCTAGRFRYAHDLSLGGGVAGGEGDLSSTGVSFVNAGFRDSNGNVMNGSLQIFGSGGTGTSTLVELEFEDTLANGGTVAARGTVNLAMQGIEAGNCDTAGFSGRLSEIGDGWKLTLVDLHAAPFCGGAAISGSFAGCTRSGSF
jgi:hypothetical protein